MTKTITCAFCSGTGKDPFDLLSSISDCQSCNGMGTVNVVEPLKKCIYCSGTGRNPLGARITCIVCGGKGTNHINSDSKCTQCKGTGKSSDGLPCTLCSGTSFH